MSTSRKVVFALITVVGLIVLVEGGARLALAALGPGEAPLGAGWETKLYRPDPLLFWRFHPNLDIETANERMIDVRINSLGLRGDEVASAKPEGTIRILAVGDSCTFGQGARTEESYPARVGRLLSERLPGLAIETINAGIPGYSSYQTRRQLETIGLELDPDVVIIAVGFNDTGEARPTKRRSFSEGLALSDAEYARAVRRSNRFGLLRLIYRLRGVSAPDVPAAGLPVDKTRVSAGEYRENLTAMIEACHDRGVLPVMLVWPNRYQSAGLAVDGRWKRVEELQEIARAVARERDSPLVDAVAVTLGHDEYFFDSVHLNPAGYAAVARAVADALDDLPPLRASR